MSSELELDIRHISRWRHHLVNAYEVKAGMVFLADQTVWSMPDRFKVVCIPCKALYKWSALPLPTRSISPSTEIFGPGDPPLSKKCQLQQIYTRNNYVVSVKNKFSNVTNRKSTISFPTSLKQNAFASSWCQKHKAWLIHADETGLLSKKSARHTKFLHV